MKVTIIYLAVVFCFTAVNTASFEKSEPIIDDVFADEIVQTEEKSITSGIDAIIKAALRTLKGVKCTVEEVIALKDATKDFIDNIQGCGAEAFDAFKNVITSAESVIATADNIGHIYLNYCKKVELINGKPLPTISCSIKMSKQLFKLIGQIKNTMDAIKKVPEVPSVAVDCTNDAVGIFNNALTSFPSNVKACSESTS